MTTRPLRLEITQQNSLHPVHRLLHIRFWLLATAWPWNFQHSMQQIVHTEKPTHLISDADKPNANLQNEVNHDLNDEVTLQHLKTINSAHRENKSPWPVRQRSES